MASLDLKWLHAQANLAWRTVVHYARKLWPWRERFGLERFRSNYVHEGLPPATLAMRALAHEPGRCTLCGTCDDVCPLVTRLPRTEFVGPMALVICGARAAPHLAEVETTLRTLVGPTCTACKACDAACPEQIPITRLGELLLGQLACVEGAKQRLTGGARGQDQALLGKGA